MTDNRNFLLAIVLSLLIFAGWQILATRLQPPAAPQSTVIRSGHQIALPAPGIAPVASSAPAVRDRAAVLASSPRVRIETPSLQGSVNLTGARIDDLVMVRHRETIAAGSPAVRLFSPSGAAGAYFAQFGWTGPGAPPPDARWTASAPVLTPAAPVTLTWANAAGQTYAIQLSIDRDYLVTARQSVTNTGVAPVTVRPNGLVSRAGEGSEKDSRTLHVGPVAVINGQLEESDIGYETLRNDGVKTYSTRGGWLGITDKYWLAALIPDQGTTAALQFSQSGGQTQTAFALPTLTVAPHAQVSTTSRLFAGAKEVAVLDRVAASGVPLFDRAIDWGHLWFIAQPIFGLLNRLFHLTGNYGIAIICLTLVVRGAMFPIAQRQFASMAKMRALQPKMKELQAKHKEDKVKLQQETMALYSAEKVNPLAGCLPIFLQIPIFFALYRSLFLTIEMRHQPFFGWIKDLSGTRSTDAGQPVRVDPVHPARGDRHRRAATLARRHLLFPAEAQPGDDGPGAAEDLPVHARRADLHHGAVRGRAGGLLDDEQPRHHRAADVPPPPPPGARAAARGGMSEDSAEQARKLFAGRVDFILSTPKLEFLPAPDLPEVAFAGRSNVGKSSLLNALTGRTGLARTSNTPGRTQELVVFEVGPEAAPVLRLIDMPGYGFAEAPKDIIRQWGRLVDDYLRGRATLKRVLVLIDARHGAKPVDRELMAMLDKAAVSYRLVLTKADKIKSTELAAVSAATLAEARTHPAAHPELLVTSSEKGVGIAELREAVLAAVAN